MTSYDLSKLEMAESLYRSGISITKHLIETTGGEIGENEINLIYENVSGSYTEKLYSNYAKKKEFVEEILSHIQPLLSQSNLVLDVGIGEGTTASPLLHLSSWTGDYFGIDLSLSRLTWANYVLNNFLPLNAKTHLSSANMSSLPFRSGAMDLVLTVYALEPNGSSAENLIAEIARVTKEYLVFVEPDFLLGDDIQKARMTALGYIPNLRPIFAKLGLELVMESRIVSSPNPLNKSSIFVLRKKVLSHGKSENKLSVSEVYSIPGTDHSLSKKFNGMYSDLGVYFPFFLNIPLLKSSDGQLLISPQLQ